MKSVTGIPALAPDTAACIITSARKAGFSAGGDLRELYERASAPISDKERVAKMREFLEGIHAVLNAIDEAPFVTIAAIPGFGGIPRLKRDLGNGFVRDLLLTGRSVNATRAQAVGLVAQLASEGEALRAARATAAQITKF